MRQPFLFLYVLLPSILVMACAKSQEEPDAINKFMTNPREVSPSNIKIDFDGDGTTDKAIISQLKGTATSLSKIITVVHPWPFNKQSVNTDDLSAGSKNNFYIILSQTKTGYVINDANPISILDTEAAQKLFVVKKDKLSEMGLDEIRENSKGDLLGIPTEAGIDTFLYWNGATFISFEPLETP